MKLPTNLEWTCAPWRELTLDDLHDALALRSRVFVVEQACLFLDIDGADRHCWHLLGRSNGVLQACLRLVAPGVKYPEPSIGRVVSAPEVRNQGIGHALMREGLAHCERLWPGQPIRISAQAWLEGFYASLGFEPVGAPYLEDDIPHIEMLRPA